VAGGLIAGRGAVGGLPEMKIIIRGSFIGCFLLIFFLKKTSHLKLVFFKKKERKKERK
jgi:hypothetical protein